MADTVVMPQAGNSVESCIVLSWRVAVGDAVAEGDILCEIETDKATMEVESTAAGTVLRLEAEEGDEVPVQAPLVILGEPGEELPDGGSVLASSSATGTTDTRTATDSVTRPVGATTGANSPAGPSDAASPTTGASASRVVRSFSTGEVRVSPRARKRAESLGIDPTTLSGSGPGGRVIDRDVVAAAENVKRTVPQKHPAPTAVPHGEAPYTDLPVTGVRRTIAKRMLGSLQESAQLTLFRKADARGLLAYREKVKNELARGKGVDGGPAPGEQAGFVANVTVNDMVMFAVSRVLGSYPEMNAHFLGDTIRRFERVDLGFAVDTPKGLLVPTIVGTDSKSLNAIARESRRLAERAVSGGATPDDLAPATFTVTNLGGLGIESFTPVLNTPQVGILGVGSIVPGYITESHEPTVIPQIGLSLTIDHRAVDGAPGARFLQDLAHHIAQFELVLAQ